MSNNKKKMTDKLQKMIHISKKMNENELKTFVKYLDNDKFGEDNIKYLLKEYASGESVHTIINNNVDWVNAAYVKELTKISFLLNNHKIRNEIGRVNILAYGPTGTGKTTLLNSIGKINQNYIFEKLNLENIISSKMGQTQINLITLAEKYNSKKTDIILFIDEIDSIISNRSGKNDVGEHSRIVSTFIKFLDLLNKNIIVLSATNVIEKIDSAIIRRFNLKIESKFLDTKTFFELINSENIFTTNELGFLKTGLKKSEFTIAEVEQFKNFFILEKAINNNSNNLSLFLEFFKNNIHFKIDKLSNKKILLLKKAGINV